MKKVYTLALLLCHIYITYAGVSSKVVTTNPAIPLINDSVTITVDLNETLEEFLLFTYEDLFLFPLNLSLKSSLGIDRLSCSAEYFRMNEKQNNIWEITFVPQQLFQNVTTTTAFKFQLKTKNYLPGRGIGKISSSYFMVVFYATADSTGAVVACNGAVGINYTDSVNGTLKWYSNTTGTFTDMNKNNQHFFNYVNTTDADMVRAQISNSNCVPSSWNQDKLVVKGYSSANLGLLVNSIPSGVVYNDNSGLLNKKVYSFNAIYPNYNQVTFANNIRMYEDGVEKKEAHILFDSATRTYSSIYTITKLYEPQHTAIIDYSEGCTDTLDLDYQRSTYSIDTSQLWIFYDSLFAVSKPFYCGNLHNLSTATFTPPVFMNFNYYNLSDYPLPDASVTLNIATPDTLLRTYVMKIGLSFPVNVFDSTKATLKNYPLGSPAPNSVNGPYAFPFLTWRSFRDDPQTYMENDSLYLFEAIFTLNTTPPITRKFYTPFRWAQNIGNCFCSANLRLDSVYILNPKPVYSQKDSIHLRVKVVNTGIKSCRLTDLRGKIFNSLTNAPIYPGGSTEGLGSSTITIQPWASYTVDNVILCTRFKNDNSNPDNLFDLKVYLKDTVIGSRWDDTVVIRIHKKQFDAKLMITDVSYSKPDTALFNDEVIRTIQVYNAGNDTSQFYGYNSGHDTACQYILYHPSSLQDITSPLINHYPIPQLQPNCTLSEQVGQNGS